MGLADNLRKLDAHSSVSKEFRVHTVQGAVVSVVTVIAVIYLISTELTFNFKTTILERVHVNATTPAGLELEFDVTLPSVSCALLNVDANDPTGQRQSLHLDKKHHVWKHRISAEGNLIGDRKKVELGSTLLSEEHLREAAVQAGVRDEGEEEEEECGSCYGAGEEGECCNTCDDVKRAYARKKWVLSPDTMDSIAVCKQEKTSEEENGEGCNVHGVVALSTGGGSLHLAPSHDLEEFGSGKQKTILDVFIRTFEQFNVSHTIHKIRFGTEYPGHVHQLDGEARIIQDGYGMYQYYFQVVPTLYRYLNGTEILTNQYSVTEHMRHVAPGSGRGLPGVFFFYQVSSLHVEIEEYQRGWIQFFTSVCAIVGGVVTMMGLLDSYLFSRAGQRGSQLVR